MNRTVGLVIGAVLIAGAAFAGGYFLATSKTASTGPGGRAAFARLTDAERQQLASMSDEERQAVLEEKGIDMPAGGPMGQGGIPGQEGASGAQGGQRGPGNSLLDGTVSSMTTNKLTVALNAGGSAATYYDDKTVVASVEGKDPKLEKGAAVIVFTEPEAAGVNAAKAIIVK
jgi:hypothetical protein